MATVTIGTAGASFATLALWEVNLVGSGGLKDNAIGQLHNIGAAHDGNTFNGIDCSAFRITIEPAQSAAFWNHVSAESNRLEYNASYGAAVSGNPGLSFSDTPVTLSGLMVMSSAVYGQPVVFSDSVAFDANKTIRMNNCIVSFRGGGNDGMCVSVSSNQKFEAQNCVFEIRHNSGIRARAIRSNLSVSGQIAATNCTFAFTSSGGVMGSFIETSAPILKNNIFINGYSVNANTDVSGTNVFGGHNMSTIATASTQVLSSASPFFGGVASLSAVFGIAVSAGATTFDMRLKPSGSPAVDGASAAWAPSVDILNRTRVAPHDMGAWDASAVFGAPPPPPAASNVYPYNPLGNLVVDLGGLRYY